MILETISGKMLRCDRVCFTGYGEAQLLTMINVGPWYCSDWRVLSEIVPLSEIKMIDSEK
jgi:hypothetical protein